MKESRYALPRQMLASTHGDANWTSDGVGADVAHDDGANDGHGCGGGAAAQRLVRAS